MTDQKASASEKSEAQPQKESKKPYEKPSFRFERVFETMALACGKISLTQKHCQFNRKSS